MADCLDHLRAQVDPDRICFVKFILEGYDHLALLSTIDRTTGEIVFRFHPAQREELFRLLDHLEVRYNLEAVIDEPAA